VHDRPAERAPEPLPGEGSLAGKVQELAHGEDIPRDRKWFAGETPEGQSQGKLFIEGKGLGLDQADYQMERGGKLGTGKVGPHPPGREPGQLKRVAPVEG